MSKDNSIQTMTLSSDREELPRTEEFAETLNKYLQFGEERFNQILLALSEAVTNAIIHGNDENPDKNVDISAWTDKGKLYIRVKDEGEGFDPDKIPDPLKDQNLLKEGGRGVFLMRQYADDVQFSDGGSTVTLLFSLPK